MNALRALLILFAVFALLGCEGGIGGTGTGAPPAVGSNSDTLISGQANKGPFADESTIVAHRLSGRAAQTSTQTAGSFGAYVLALLDGAAYRVDATGPYFSELLGEMSDGPVTLSAIVEEGTTQRANVNLATHIVHLRILHLVDLGISFGAAIDTADAELTAAVAPVIPAPANPIHFSDLVVVNGAQDGSNAEGDAWLLALTSMIERAAIDASSANGTSVQAELTELSDRLAQDLADDGVIDVTLLEELNHASNRLDPDRIAGHLFEYALLHFDELSLNDADSATVDSLQAQIDSVQSTTGGSMMAPMCEAFGDEVICAGSQTFQHGSRHQVMAQLGGMASGNVYTMPLEDMVPNMNRFIDSDDDGVVNQDDDDDDNDGIPDADDDTPYGE